MIAPILSLIPIQELTPGQVGAIRNQTINQVVAMAVKRLSTTEDRLLVRDIRPLEDLEMYAGYSATGSTNDWRFDCTSSAGYQQASAERNLQDNTFIALYGIRDLRLAIGASGYAASTPLSDFYEMSRVSLVKISMGGAGRVIWDVRGLEAYAKDAMVGFSPTPVVITPGTSYKIEFFVDRAVQGGVWLQLIGVVVEQRGLVVSP